MSFIYILVAVSSVLVKDFLLCIGVNFKSVNAGFEPRMDFMQLEYWLHSAICTGGMCFHIPNKHGGYFIYDAIVIYF